ncbi:MAG: hypothetical protein ACI8XB_003089 [Patiriisocius sp.]|jgi:hypothetical protein
MRIIILVVLVTAGSFSCTKEKLKDDASILIGKWKWCYSSAHIDGFCSEQILFVSAGSTTYEFFNPTSENTIYHIEFLEKGKIIFSEENTVLSEEKILWEMSEISTGKYFYELYFDKEIKLDGIINQDTLMENRLFPFPDTDCDDYTNFFVRE